jgi:hypothetical protein
MAYRLLGAPIILPVGPFAYTPSVGCDAYEVLGVAAGGGSGGVAATGANQVALAEPGAAGGRFRKFETSPAPRVPTMEVMAAIRSLAPWSPGRQAWRRPRGRRRPHARRHSDGR